MNGIQQRIAFHVQEDLDRACQLALLNELSVALGGAYHPHKYAQFIWDANIGPWGNHQGYDIHLRTVASNEKLLQVKHLLEEKLEVQFKKLPCSSLPSPDYEANWKTTVRITLGT